jgi:hypothetical protein
MVTHGNQGPLIFNFLILINEIKIVQFNVKKMWARGA